jgi:hypothetical protein
VAWGDRLINATRAGFGAFRREWADPSEQGGAAVNAERRYSTQRLWSYYANTVYEDTLAWQAYRSRYSLYRAVRSIYNPTRRLVEFYAGQVYPGVLSEDGSQLPDGVPLAIPLAKDTPEELSTAVAQFWAWSNWQANKAVFVRYGSIAGSVLVEVLDELDRRKVCANVVWPGLVTAIDLDGAGNVKMYALEYKADDEGQTYTYRKEVDTDEFRYFRDDRPYDYDGEGAVQPNPYGFVPAVWARHVHTGGTWGAPAMDGSLGKIDELNSIASHVHDQIHKKVNAPAYLAGVTSLKPLTSSQNRPRQTDYIGSDAQVVSDREDMLLIGGPAGSDVKSMAGTLELGDAGPYIDKLMGEIEADHPELLMYRQLREMSQVTAPGAAQIMGDTYARVVEAQASYDQQSQKLFGMATAIAGWRANTGAWGPGLDRQRQKFLAFDLTSYERGDLDFGIAPRPLVMPTQQQRFQEQLTAAQAIQQYTSAGMPVEIAYKLVTNASDEELAMFTQDRMAAIQRQQVLAQSDIPSDPTVAAIRQ